MHIANKLARQVLILLSLAGLAQLDTSATITLNVGAADLKSANGSLMPTTGLVLLVASTNGTFGGPTATSFVSGNNVEVGRWDLSGQSAGNFAVAINSIPIPAGLSSGNALMLYWFPTLTISASAPGGGTSYGYYRDATAAFGNYNGGLDQSDPWFIPADGATVNIYFVTTDPDAGGSTPATNGLASYTVLAPPVANSNTYTRTGGTALKIVISDLLTNDTDPNGYTLSLTSLGLTTTNNVALTTNATELFYPATAPNVNDAFTYTISDGHVGGVATGNVYIQVLPATGTSSVVSLQIGVPGAKTNTLTFAGVPGYQYIAQFATNVVGPYLPFSTNTANSSNGLWTILDPTATNAQRFYRVQH